MIWRSIAFIIFISFFFVQISFGHPGRTDKDGGHWDHQKKEYHYHKDGKVTVDKAKSKDYDKLTPSEKGEKEVKAKKDDRKER